MRAPVSLAHRDFRASGRTQGRSIWDFSVWDCFWSLGFGVWDLEFGIWSLGFGVWDFSLARRANVLARDHDIVEVNNIRCVFCPSIRHVRFQRKRVGFQRFRLAPVDAAPVAEQMAVHPKRLLAIRCSGSV